MSEETKIKELEALISHQERITKKNGTVNAVVYTVICAIFIAYALFLPGMVADIVDEEKAPATLVQMLRDQVPSNNELVSQANSQIPILINQGFDKIESELPQIEAYVGQEVLKMNQNIVDRVKLEVKPHLMAVIKDKKSEIKAMLSNVKDQDNTQLFHNFIDDEINTEMNKALSQLKGEISDMEKTLDRFRTSKTLTEKELAQKRLLIAYIRLSEDEAFRKEITEDIVNNLREFYKF